MTETIFYKGPTQAAPNQAQPDPFGADPWGAPAQAAQSTVAAAPPHQAANPWGAPAASITAPSPAQPPSDPWGAPAANDPFGAPVQSTPAPVVQQAPPPQDPFSTADPFGGGVPAQQGNLQLIRGSCLSRQKKTDNLYRIFELQPIQIWLSTCHSHLASHL